MKNATKNKIISFNKNRDWDKFHSPANLAKSISIEANELLECFQWSDEKYDINEVKEELADVLVYCYDLVHKLKLDEDKIVLEKLKNNEKKYPINKCKGKSTKYNKLK